MALDSWHKNPLILLSLGAGKPVGLVIIHIVKHVMPKCYELPYGDRKGLEGVPIFDLVQASGEWRNDNQVPALQEMVDFLR